jgi:unsaturated rhamnogalacturonyl hydrolase
MAGEDTSGAALAAPARSPLTEQALHACLDDMHGQLIEATLAMGVRRWFWGEGVCLLAAVRASASRGQGPPDFVVDYARRFLSTAPVVEHVNNLAPGAAVAELHRHNPDAGFDELLRSCVDWFEQAPAATRAPNGALEHWPGGVWADTVYMAGEFLLRAGQSLGRPDLIGAAVDQWLAHAELLQFPVSGLVAHGTDRGRRIDCFWGRANAWFALVGADLSELDMTVYPRVQEVRERLARQLFALADLQPPHGVWDVLVDSPPECRGILETSAAAGIGAAMLRAGTFMRSSVLVSAGDLAVRGALAYVDDGTLTRVSAGTVLQLIPFGYSVIRDDRQQPWGQGLALEAVAAWRDAFEPPHLFPAPSHRLAEHPWTTETSTTRSTNV